MFKPVTALAVVVAQLVERLLLTQEIRGLNPDIGEILSTKCTIEKTKIKKKRPGMAHLFKSVTAPGNTAQNIIFRPKCADTEQF